MPRRAKQIILLAGDVVLMYLSLWVALWIRYWGFFDYSILSKHLPIFTLVFALWLLIFFTSGLYGLASIWNIYRALRGFLGAMVVNTLLAISLFYLIPYFGITPKTILFLQLGFFTLLFSAWRIVYGRILREIGATRNLIIVGAKSAPLELVRTIVQSPELGYDVAALFNLNGRSVPEWVLGSGIRVGKNLSQLKKIIKEGEVNAVVVSKDLYPKVFGSLYRIIPTGVGFYDLDTFWEELNRSIPISEADEIWFLENLRGVRKRLYEIRTRGIDIVLSLVLGGFSLILLPFIALGIKLADNGPVFYRQKRVGRDGKVFKIIKFRTMVTQAEKSGARWATENDPRVTRFGRFLRTVRLDELPQILNVLGGSMSFIGPRPERPELVKILTKNIPHYNLRHLIRPGLTGWAQVNYPYGSSEKDAEKKLRYDLYYLKHRSLLMDAEIILKTIRVVVSRKGV